MKGAGAILKGDCTTYGTVTTKYGVMSDWDVSLSHGDATRRSQSKTTFNGDISNWDVSSVVDMNYMFYSANAFNGDISNWDVSSVVTMSHMFYSANLVYSRLE